MSSHHPALDAVAELESLADDLGVRFLDLQFSDVMGAVKTVTVPADRLAEAVARGIWFDGSCVDSFARTAETDMYLIPDLDTFRLLPWGEIPTGRLFCSVRTPDGEAYPGDPRDALRRACERAAGLGYEYRLGTELEFFLLERDGEGRIRVPPGDRGSYFDFTTDRSVGVRQAMVSALQRMGIDVDTLHHEVGAGQHEIDLAHAPALTAADTVVSVRYTLKAIAQTFGLIASFMPKPFYGRSGSGMHTHQSLARLEDGSNAFAQRRDEYALSDIAKHFIAGQLQHAAAMSAVLSPLVNSYKRLVRGFEAPIFVSWARTNRGALVRVPHVAREEAARIELRNPDPSCNPYLAFAVMLWCGLDGIERRLPLPEPIEESLYGFDDSELARRNVGLLPDNLHDAVVALERDDVVRAALGDHLTERFVEAKQMEWREYREQVTGWELEHYLEGS